jgi:hypothetical protein
MERHIQRAKDAQDDEERTALRRRKATNAPTNGKVAV